MTIKEFFSFKTNKYFWLNLIAMVAVVILLLFGVLKWLDVYTRHGEAVVVPDVKGMTVGEAEMLLRNHGLVCVVSDSNYVKNKPAGSILELNPSAGQKVKEGRTIYLAAGFKLSESELISGEKDWVYGVKYKGRQLNMGDKVPVGATLTLLVGDGETQVQDRDSLEIVEDAAGTTDVSTDDSWF